MAILNALHIINLTEEGAVAAMHPVPGMLVDIFENDEVDYWLLPVDNGLSITNSVITNIIPDDILSRIRTGSIFLLLTNMFEAFTNLVDPIYTEIVYKLAIPEDNVLLLSGTPDIIDIVRRVSIERCKKEIKVAWVIPFLKGIPNQIRKTYSGTSFSNRTQTKFNKKFINFGGRWRLHRPALVALLLAKNLLDYGYVSLFEHDDHMNWNKIWKILIDHHRLNSIAFQLLEENKEKIINLPPQYIDTVKLTPEHIGMYYQSMSTYYNDTYFSVVSETNYYTTGSFISTRCLTEKTLKPIAYGHPFIILGPPGTLRLVRQLGFKTFSPCINESYDEELDDIKRMLMIVDEIERLCKLEGDALSEFLVISAAICNHNYAVFMDPRIQNIILLN